MGGDNCYDGPRLRNTDDLPHERRDIVDMLDDIIKIDFLKRIVCERERHRYIAEEVCSLTRETVHSQKPCHFLVSATQVDFHM